MDNIFCVLSPSGLPTQAMKDLWKDAKSICKKEGFMYKGSTLNVFFPNVPALKKDNGGYKVTWPLLREDVVFGELEDGLIKGVYDPK